MTALTESDYLDQQAKNARLAIAHTVADLACHLKNAADPAAWTRTYPKAGVGVGLLAGFIAAAAAVPSRRHSVSMNMDQFTEHLRSRLSSDNIGQSSEPPAAVVEIPVESDSPPPKEKSRNGLIGAVIVEALALARPLITQFIKRSMAQHKTRDQDHSDQAAPESSADHFNSVGPTSGAPA